MSPPALTALPGGADLTDDIEQRQEDQAWGVLVDAIEVALRGLHPLHSARGDFLGLRRAYLRAADAPARANLAAITPDADDRARAFRGPRTNDETLSREEH